MKDGDIIDLGDRKLEVLHTPGHSSDSMCLLDKNARLLWTGDTFYTGAIYVHLPDSDLDAFIRSYERMITLFPLYERLMPSHNEPWVKKSMLEEVLEAAQKIRAGDAEYVEGMDEDTRIRRYEYANFAIMTKAN